MDQSITPPSPPSIDCFFFICSSRFASSSESVSPPAAAYLHVGERGCRTSCRVDCYRRLGKSMYSSARDSFRSSHQTMTNCRVIFHIHHMNWPTYSHWVLDWTLNYDVQCDFPCPIVQHKRSSAVDFQYQERFKYWLMRLWQWHDSSMLRITDGAREILISRIITDDRCSCLRSPASWFISSSSCCLEKIHFV